MINNLKGPKGNNQYKDIEPFTTDGGMGTLLRATDTNDNSKVVLKLMAISSPTHEKLLKNEFDISIDLKHSNIVNTRFADKTNIGGINYFYSVMDYIQGGDLKRFISDLDSNIPICNALDFMIGITKGIVHAHKTIIHRDLKPLNILVGEKNNLMICDFGLSKYVNELTRTHTYKGKGTYYYMSPEAWKGEDNLKQMDIYSLGLIFFEILTRKRPFDAVTINELKEMHLYHRLPNLLDLRRDVPTKLAYLIGEMGEKNYRKRIDDANVILKTLQELRTICDDKKEDELEPVLKGIHNKIESFKSAELEASKISSMKKKKEKMLEFSIENFMDMLKSAIKEINRGLGKEELTIVESMKNVYSGFKSYSVGFLDDSFQISFFAENEIENFIESRKKERKQMENNNMLMKIFPTESKLNIVEDLIQLVGIVKATNTSRGYNLVLRLEHKNDDYGVWHMCNFSDNPIVHKRLEENYALGKDSFFHEYELCRPNITHSRKMKIREVDKAGLIDMLKLIINEDG